MVEFSLIFNASSTSIIDGFVYPGISLASTVSSWRTGALPTKFLESETVPKNLFMKRSNYVLEG